MNQAAKLRFMMGGTPDMPLVIRMVVRRRRPARRPALPEPRGALRPYPRPRRRDAVEPVRREGPARRGDPGRQPRHLPRAEAPLLRRSGAGARGALRDRAREGRDRTRRHRRDGGGARRDGAPRAPGRRELEEEGVSVEVVDPRTLVPLDTDTIAASVAKTHRARRRARGGAVRRLRSRDRGTRRRALLLGARRAGRPGRGAVPPDAVPEGPRARDPAGPGRDRRRGALAA